MSNNWDKHAKANAKTIEHEIDKLKIGHWHLFKRQYREFWIHAKEISNMFKTLKPLSQEDRDRLWTRYSSICDEAKRTQAKEKESRLADSKIKKDLVKSKIKEAYHQAKGSSSASDLSKAKYLLNEALEWMKDGWGGFSTMTQVTSLTEGKLTKEDREECWSRWKEASETIRSQRQYLCDLNFNHFRPKAYNALSKADYDPHEAKSQVKDIQQEMRGTLSTKSQFQEIHNLLDEVWRKANSRLQENYRIKQEKHNEWIRKTEECIERWSDLIEKNESVIARIEDQIDRCQEMERNARSDDFAYTVRGWIEEKYRKIADIRETNRQLEDKIRSARDKIR